MGLLVNANDPERLPAFIVKAHGFLCVVCYAVGIVWFLSLAWNGNNAGTYFSESALLPGLVENEFTQDSVARTYLRDLQEEMESHNSDVPTCLAEASVQQTTSVLERGKATDA